MPSFERLLPPEEDATYVKHATVIVGLWVIVTAIVASILAGIAFAIV